jgi:hypothetical protein
VREQAQWRVTENAADVSPVARCGVSALRVGRYRHARHQPTSAVLSERLSTSTLASTA